LGPDFDGRGDPDRRFRLALQAFYRLPPERGVCAWRFDNDMAGFAPANAATLKRLTGLAR
jgi:hypothetical protein